MPYESDLAEYKRKVLGIGDDTDEIALNRCGVCGDQGIMGLCGDCARLSVQLEGPEVRRARSMGGVLAFWDRADLDAWLQDKGINPAFHETGAHLHPEVTINFRPMRWGLNYTEARFSEPRV